MLLAHFHPLNEVNAKVSKEIFIFPDIDGIQFPRRLKEVLFKLWMRAD